MSPNVEEEPIYELDQVPDIAPEIHCCQKTSHSLERKKKEKRKT